MTSLQSIRYSDVLPYVLHTAQLYLCVDGLNKSTSIFSPFIVDTNGAGT